MVVDTSALVAALSGEPQAGLVLDTLAADPAPSLSTGTLLEARIVMLARNGEKGVRDLDLLLQAAQATVVPGACGPYSRVSPSPGTARDR